MAGVEILLRTAVTAVSLVARKVLLLQLVLVALVESMSVPCNQARLLLLSQ
jgi:hypothetical protein